METVAFYSPEGKEDRLRVAGIVATMALGISALDLAGWFGEPWGIVVDALLAWFGAIGAAAIYGTSFAERIRFAAPFSLGSMVAMVATAWYAASRSELFSIELVLPLGIGAAAGAALHFLLSKTVAMPTPRGVLVGLAALVVLLPVAVVVVFAPLVLG